MANDGGARTAIEELDHVAPDVLDAINRLLPQVSSRAREVTADRLRMLLDTPSTRILLARLDGEIVGMALLITMTTLTGQSGYVEEVAVDERARGQRIGTLLMQHLLAEAAAMQLDFVDLTSRSTRVAANRLYRSVGFDARETNVYRHRLASYRS